jgi:hypothetical protein
MMPPSLSLSLRGSLLQRCLFSCAATAQLSINAPFVFLNFRLVIRLLFFVYLNCCNMLSVTLFYKVRERADVDRGQCQKGEKKEQKNRYV